MADMMISDLKPAVALSATDKFEIEQASQLESTHLTVSALLSHIDNELLTTIKGNITSLQVSIGGSNTTLSVVEGRVSTAESNITALQTALANEITNRTNADSAISATVTTVTNNLNTEITNRTSADNALDARIKTNTDDVQALKISVDGKAPLVHTHVIADITGLTAALNAKEPANANIQAHIGITSGNPHGTTKNHLGLGNVDNTSDANKPVSTAQQAALDGKANSVHTHAISQVTGLQTALDGKAPTVHTHAIGDVTGLQTALNNKAPLNHTHVIADTTGLQAALDSKTTATQKVADDLANEVLARIAVQNEVETARGAFPTLDDRLDNLAVSAGAVTSVFGRSGDVVAQAGDYKFSDLSLTPTTLAGYGITDAANKVHVHSASDITSGVLSVARGGTGGLGFQYIISDTKPTGVPVGTRWLDSTTGREYTLHQDADEIIWVQWSGGQPIQGTDPMGIIANVVWGDITGTLADQLDLQAVLDTKADITGEAFSGPVSATTISDSLGNVRNLLPTTANAATTLDATHINKVVEKGNNTAYTYTISPDLGVQGDVITIINSGTAGDVTIARGTGVALYRNGTDANLTVSPGSMVTIYRTATANRWIG